MDFDIKRLGLGERIVGGGALLLFIDFFFINWWSVGFLGTDVGISAWDAHTFLRWLILLTIILALGHTFMRVTGKSADLPADPGMVLAGLAGALVVLLLFRMFINQPGPKNELIDIGIGAWVGLISLIAIAAGAFLSMGEQSTAPSTAPASTPPPA